MQIKTIQKVISVKLTEWLNTITDEKLRSDLKNNILVSGGSITSMLLNEPVNDYDVYIKNVDVLKKLVEYYISPFTEIKILDGRNKTSLVEKILNDYKFNDSVKTIDDINSNYAVNLRNLKEDQIKLWFDTNDSCKKVELDKESDKKYTPLFFSPNAISLSDDLQIVIRFHGDNEAIHKTFDFIHATNYFTFEQGLVTNKEALESIITKQLRYQGSLYPVTTIIRMKKFIKRGWNINAGEMLKVMFQISEINLKHTDTLEEQLLGVDVAYFQKLIEILRGTENIESKMTSQYLNTIIDRVFNEYDMED
jgi:hypothetical protein